MRARIEEIIKFKAFDALKPYAVKQKLILSKCNQMMLNNDEIKGFNAPVDQVITFLEKNVGKSKEVKPTRDHYYKYLDTEGWGGEYPYVSFWFTETKKGWEWSGIAYCKTSLFKLKFPKESRFK